MSDIAAESKVLVQRDGNVLIVIINRPEARNAIDREVSDLVGEALEQAEADNDVRVIVLTGAGDTAFCAGADLKAIARGENILASGDRHAWSLAGFARHFVTKPTIAAVNGTAQGGGTELALACDLIVASETANFGLPEVKRGLIAAAGGLFRVGRAIPQKIALELILTGESIDAREAERWGLVNRVVPAGGVLDAALELARKIAANAPLAVQASKRVAYALTDGEPLGEADLWASTFRELGPVARSNDAKEGPRAFAEKRQPEWSGT
jgi:crotonobetainyl-CoA hydratase